MAVTVTRAGFLSSVQDLGRAGHRASGVSLGGALDGHALAVANLLVGNAPAAAGIEVALGQLRLRFHAPRLIAWAGGAFHARVGEEEIHAGHAALLQAGEEFELEAKERGGRAWLALAGGIDLPPVLGSRATDLRSHFGGLDGRCLRDGDELPLGTASPDATCLMEKIGLNRVANWRAPWDWASTAPIHPFLRIVRGAEWGEFKTAAHAALARETYSVRAESDRMGVRMKGAALARKVTTEMTSSAVAPGTLQVPPSGQPILLLGDCQTVGGYPKIAHVITVDLPAAAQLSLGDEVRFAEVTQEEAERLLLERARDLERFRVGLKLHWR